MSTASGALPINDLSTTKTKPTNELLKDRLHLIITYNRRNSNRPFWLTKDIGPEKPQWEVANYVYILTHLHGSKPINE